MSSSDDSGRFARVKEAALRAAELSEQERRTFLDQASDGDPELRGEIEALLSHDETPHSLLQDDALLRRAAEAVAETGRLAGQTIAQYEILEFLEAGGMGEVYRARDTRLGRDVAFKVISPEITNESDRLRRFEQEARAAGSLNHPNVVVVHDVGEQDGLPYVVMELLQGESLGKRLRRGPLSVRKACEVAMQAACGLAAAHEKGIVHRDVKPENLFLTRDGRVKVLDFGIAKLTRPEALLAQDGKRSPDSLTGTGMILGTSGYMSPEQARGEPADARSDLFALGAILYEMIAGRRAFERGTAVESMHAVLTEEPPPLRSLKPEAPAGLDAIVRRCLEKSPGERFQSGRDLAFALEALSGSVPLHRQASATTQPSRRRLVTRRWIAIYAACALVVGLVGMIIGRLAESPARVDLSKYRLAPFATSLATQAFSSWSPDGKAIAFLGRKNDSPLTKPQIWIQRDGGVTPVPITDPTFEPWGGRPLWSADARSIYEPATIGGKGGVYRIPAGGGEPVLVQPDAGNVLALSPDGRTLTWSEEDSAGTWNLYYASPPDAPRQRCAPAPSIHGVLGVSCAGFAPDGTKLLLFFETPAKGLECWLLPWPPDKGRRVFSELSGKDPGFSWMPDSRHVVFSVQQDPTQPWRICLGDTKSGRFWPVHLGQGVGVTFPSVSPDGRRIAFSSVAETYDVIQIPIEAGVPRTILGSFRIYDQPALSADGKELIYTSDVRGPYEVWLRDLRSGLDKPLIASGDFADAADFMSPALSGDGQRYVVSIGRWTNGSTAWKLYVGLVGGGAPVRATTEEVALEAGATWSPDGTALAYLRYGLSLHPASMAVVRPGGTESPVTLLDQCVLDLDAKWSPTGQWIAVGDATGTHVVLVSPDGARKRDLPADVGWAPKEACWSPDGRYLYVVESSTLLNRYELVSIDQETGRRRQIRDLDRLIPNASLGRDITISATPDGRSLVYSVGSERSEIWTLEGLQLPKPWYARLLP